MPKGVHNNHVRGKNHYRWNSEKLVSDSGYIRIRVGVTHPLADPNGYAWEKRSHRKVERADTMTAVSQMTIVKRIQCLACHHWHEVSGQAGQKIETVCPCCGRKAQVWL